MVLNTSDRSSTRSERCALPGPHTSRAISDCRIGASERGHDCSTATADNRSGERSKRPLARMHEYQRCDYSSRLDASRLLNIVGCSADTTRYQNLHQREWLSIHLKGKQKTRCQMQ